jgi:uncharacterized membrane protein YdjX (TVP38/TMEM64 family)
VALRIASLGLLALAGGALWWWGGLSDLDPQQVGTWVRSAGAWGPALFLVLFSLGNGLGAPGILFVVPAAALWPPWQSFLLAWLGSIGAGCVGYVFARGIGRQFVEAHLPRRLRSIDQQLGARPVRSVAFLRLTLYLAAPVHWALGLSSVPPRALLLGSAVGFAPPAAAWTLASGELFEAIREGRPAAFLALAALGVLAIGAMAWFTRQRAESDA